MGRYGPYVLHDKKYTSIRAPYNLLDITLEQAVELIATAPPKRGQAAGPALKELGPHPDDGKDVRVLNGRYGPYVKCGRINATLPKDMEPTEVTMELAVELLANKKKAPKKAKRRR